jgi:predicted anti-sigma-YlaC factor YlaD
VKCSSTRDLMMRHFDGEFNDIESAKMKQHLKYCKECMYEFEELKSIFSVIELSGDVTPPEGFEQAVMSKIHSIESARFKRMSAVLIILYNLAVLVSIGLLVLFATGLEGLAVLGVSMREAADLGFFSTLIARLYSYASELFQAFLNIGMLFYQTCLHIIDMYYHYIIFIVAALLTIQRAFMLQLK